MKQTCSHCSHWGGDLGYGRDTEKGKSCEHPLVIRAYNTDRCPPNGMVVENDEGWGLVTGPDFGCVLFSNAPVSEVS